MAGSAECQPHRVFGTVEAFGMQAYFVIAVAGSTEVRQYLVLGTAGLS